jgi:hypothetical protein
VKKITNEFYYPLKPNSSFMKCLPNHWRVFIGFLVKEAIRVATEPRPVKVIVKNTTISTIPFGDRDLSAYH